MKTPFSHGPEDSDTCGQSKHGRLLVIVLVVDRKGEGGGGCHGILPLSARSPEAGGKGRKNFLHHWGGGGLEILFKEKIKIPIASPSHKL